MFAINLVIAASNLAAGIYLLHKREKFWGSYNLFFCALNAVAAAL